MGEFDLSTFSGRARYFFWVTDPRLCLESDESLDRAKNLIASTKASASPSVNATLMDVVRARQLYESAFHPDTGEKQNIFGRMCFQVPGGMAITGIMLTFYKTNTAVVFWQWVNQSFNAFVNYTNRNANSPLSNAQMGTAYVSATFAACFTAIKIKNYLSKNARPFFLRYVPFCAVAAANCVNIPFMRQNEITKGVNVLDENGNVVAQSKLAAAKGISQVVVSRIIMCAPGMIFLPVIMEKLCQHSGWVRKNTWFHAPFQTFGVGAFLIVMVPTACAIFPQLSSINVETLKQWEPKSFESIKLNSGNQIPSKVYYNKGL